MARGLEDPLLARRVDGARRSRGAAVHEGQDVRALPQSPVLLPQAPRAASGGALLSDHGRASDARDRDPGVEVDGRGRTVLASERAIQPAAAVRTPASRPLWRLSSDF